jgi:hypothetical protein
MARRKTLTEYLETLPDDTAAVRIRVGDNNNPPTVAMIALGAYKSKDNQYAPIYVEDLEELAQAVEGEALEAGWPEESPVLRLHAYTASGGQLPTFSRTAKGVAGTSPTGGDGPLYAIIGRLVDGHLAFGAEMRRTVDILTETLAHRETMAQEALESALSSRQDAQDAEMQAYAAQLAADEMGQIESNGPFDGAAGDMLAGLLAKFTGQPEADAEGLADIIDSDPSILDDLVQDEGLMGRVMAAWQKKNAGETQEEAYETPQEEPIEADSPPAGDP